METQHPQCSLSLFLLTGNNIDMNKRLHPLEQEAIRQYLEVCKPILARWIRDDYWPTEATKSVNEEGEGDSTAHFMPNKRKFLPL